jgi:hypothetical protein
MADFTIGAGSNPYHGRARKGASTPVIQYFPASTCVSTATIKYGDVVSQDTNVSTGGFRCRQAYRGGGTGANLLAIGQHILGVAVEADASDGSATGLSSAVGTVPANRQIGIAIADGETEFVGYLTGNAAVSASSLVGQQKSMIYDATNHVFLVDSTNSTVALNTVTITGIPDGTEGSTNGPVYFKFLSSNVSEAVQ